MNPGELSQRLATALRLHQRGELDTAETLYRQCLAAAPRSYDALHLLGVLHLQRGRLELAVTALTRALAEHAGEPNGHAHLAQALVQLGRYPLAIERADAAVRLDPRHAQAWLTRGDALQHLRQYAGAAESYARGLALDPNVPEAWSNQANALRMLRRLDAALACVDRALKLRPRYSKALNNRGLIRFDGDRPGEAVTDFLAAVELGPDDAEVRMNLATALTRLKRHEEAAQQLARLAASQPEFPYIDGILMYARAQTLEWTHHAALAQRIRDGVCRAARADVPMSFLCVSGDAGEQRRCAEIFTAAEYPAQMPASASAPAPTSDGRVRIAYVSCDFGEHAVTYLLAGVWERHDRRRFETYAISWGRRDASTARMRAEAAFDHFIDVTDRSDADVAALMRRESIDIAVDLTGYTRGHRTGIFARRAAPIQVNFLGFPASMGAPYIDYLIADRFVAPLNRLSQYAERIVWMPEIFQPNDDRRALPTAGPSRSHFGLPEEGAVLCSFNEAGKINPILFDSWGRILSAVPDSVLWLLAQSARARDNLRREAVARGVDPVRLVFAEHLPYLDHLWRYTLADLFLDSTPFSAGATASDAVSMGLPVLTAAGDSFASRMAGSILTMLGFADLVTGCLADYEARAIALLRDRERLSSLRAGLRDARTTHPYFQTERYCRHLEAAYTAMRARARDGLAPQLLAVEPIAGES
jgi:protein O-GlcNAc transferase